MTWLRNLCERAGKGEREIRGGVRRGEGEGGVEGEGGAEGEVEAMDVGWEVGEEGRSASRPSLLTVHADKADSSSVQAGPRPHRLQHPRHPACAWFGIVGARRSSLK